MLSIDAISNVNQSAQTNVKNNTHFKGLTLLPPEAEDMFIKATKQEQNNMLKRVG